MPPKRKSDADVANASAFSKDEPALPTKKARVSDASGASYAVSSKENIKPTRWQDIVLEDEDEEGDCPIYDDCNEIRRKIRLLEKTPGFKITHWLRDIGNINSNSFGRFMKAKGPSGGAENGTYLAAYLYFEKNRILEGKKKIAKRLRNEEEHPGGLTRRDGIRGQWVIVAR